MPELKVKKKPSLMSDAAVQNATGKTWPEWFSILDKAGAKKMTHREIVAFLVKKYAVGPWWQQMVTVAYEQQRGLREVHQVPGGYSISVSKTIGVRLPALYAAWKDEKSCSRWLDDADFNVRKATANKSMRITWVDGETNLEVNFYSKGPAKAQVVVQHNKLKNSQAAERKKAYWAKQLGRLKEELET